MLLSNGGGHFNSAALCPHLSMGCDADHAGSRALPFHKRMKERRLAGPIGTKKEYAIANAEGQCDLRQIPARAEPIDNRREELDAVGTIDSLLLHMYLSFGRHDLILECQPILRVAVAGRHHVDHLNGEEPTVGVLDDEYLPSLGLRVRDVKFSRAMLSGVMSVSILAPSAMAMPRVLVGSL